jgi:indole-3-glycerol phosphate synthase
MSLPVPDPLRRAAEARRAHVEAIKLATPGYLLRQRLGSPRPGGRLERRLRRGPGEPLRLLCAIPSSANGAQADALARRCEAGGAAGLALTTEPGAAAAGQVESVRAATSLPLLLADLVVDGYQLLEAAVRGADGALLAAALCSDVQLQVLVGQARLLGLDPLVVVRDEDELERAVTAGATLVAADDGAAAGAPAEDEALLALLAAVPPLVAAVAWRETCAPARIARLWSGRCDAVRVGGAPAGSTDPVAALAELVRAARG